MESVKRNIFFQGWPPISIKERPLLQPKLNLLSCLPLTPRDSNKTTVVFQRSMFLNLHGNEHRGFFRNLLTFPEITEQSYSKDWGINHTNVSKEKNRSLIFD